MIQVHAKNQAAFFKFQKESLRGGEQRTGQESEHCILGEGKRMASFLYPLLLQEKRAASRNQEDQHGVRAEGLATAETVNRQIVHRTLPEDQLSKSTDNADQRLEMHQFLLGRTKPVQITALQPNCNNGTQLCST